MRCFIHGSKEAIAACRKCGKGMCDDCSAYSGHTGICPACRRDEFVAERNALNGQYNSQNAQMQTLKNSRIKVSVISAVIAVAVFAVLAVMKLFFICWIPLSIAGVYLLIKIVSINNQIKQINTNLVPVVDRIDYLNKEIEKLTKALTVGHAHI